MATWIGGKIANILAINPSQIQINTQDKLTNDPNAESSSSNIKEHESEKTNIVGDLMWPIMLFLRLSGHSCLTYEKQFVKTPSILHSEKTENRNDCRKRETETIRNYRIVCKSFLFFWSVLCATLIFYAWCYKLHGIWKLVEGRAENHTAPTPVIANTDEELTDKFGLKTPDPDYKPITVTVLIAIGALLAIIQLCELILAWMESASLATFLNDWAPLQKEFEKTFSHPSLSGSWSVDLKRRRNVLIIVYVAIPTVLFVPSYLLSNGVNGFNAELFRKLPYAWHLCAVSLMEDVKIVMTYWILAATFAHVREGMLCSMKWEGLKADNVKAWRLLIHSLRCQVDKAGDSQKGHQLLLIGGCIFLITSSVFMLLQGHWKHTNIVLILVSGIGFLVLQFGRLYLKVLAANRITHEESLMAQELVRMNVGEEDIGIKLEVTFLYYVIVENPAVISFGSYVKLNKKLLLKVGSQVVTYLIVLMQLTNQ